MDHFWRDRPTFVTGATGHIGSWAVKRLVALGADVVCLVRDWVPQCEFVDTRLVERVKTVRGDLRDADVVERALGEYEIDTVLHFAAQSIVGTANRNPGTTFDTNIRGTWTLLEACRHNTMVKQIVLASTDKSYGEHDELPYHEGMALQPRYPHDVSKACADLLGMCYAATYDLAVGITRLPNIFGGGDLNWPRLIPGTIRSIIRGEPPVITSNGLFIRDYLYVEDAAAAHLLLAEKLAEAPEVRGEVFNLSNGDHLTVLELVSRILQLMGSDLEPEVLDRVKHEIKNQYLDANKARRMLGYQPLHTMDEGLNLTIDWYRSYFEKGETP
jgi:CDP-glucose 4,6-dehydratase